MTSIQAVTFYVPATSREPIEIKAAHSGLRMVLVGREAVGMLDQGWGVLGVYFLLGPTDDPDHYRAYVGEVGRRTLLMRVREHASQKEWWSRALLIASASDEFNSAEIGWLEGRLYDVLNNAVAAEVMNRGRPGDDSIAERDRGGLERYIEPIMAALRASGAPPDTADQKPAPPGRKPRARYSESVKDLIDARLLKPGTRLHPTRPALTETALVREDGSLEVGGQLYAAVSPAAMAVSGNKSEPGWEFWGVPSGGGGFVALHTLRLRLREGREGEGPTEAAHHAPPEPAEEGIPAPDRPRSPRRFTETVGDLIEAALLSVGQELQPARRTLTQTATVLGDGRLRVGDEVCRSLSGAAQVVSGNKAEPGWEFWQAEVDGEPVSLHELRERYRAQAER